MGFKSPTPCCRPLHLSLSLTSPTSLELTVGLAADSFDPPYSHALLTAVLLFRETNGVRQATLTTSSNTYKLTLAFMRTSPSLLLSQC